MEQEMRDGFIALEAKFDEHRDGAKERHKEFCIKIDRMYQFINNQQHRKEACMAEMREHVSKAVGYALGIPTSLVAILFVIIKIREWLGG